MSGTIGGLAGMSLGAATIAAVAVRRAYLAPSLLVAFGLRAAAALGEYFWLDLPASQFDAVRFERTAWTWVESRQVLDAFGNAVGPDMYSWIGAVIYSVVGRSPLVLHALNVVLGTLVVANAAVLVYELSNSELAAKRVGWILAMFPASILYSAVLLREVFITLMLVAGTRALVSWARSHSTRAALSTLVFYAIGALFHGAIIVVMAVPLCLFFWRAMREARYGRALRSGRMLMATAGGVLLLGVLIASGWATQKMRGLEAGIVTGLAVAQESRARDRGAYLVDRQVESLSDIVTDAPLRLAYFLFAPFPWAATSAIDIVGAIDGLAYATMLALLIGKRAWRAGRHSALIPALVFLIGVLVFSQGTSNYGAAIRHRAKFLPLLLASSAALVAVSSAKELGSGLQSRAHGGNGKRIDTAVVD